MKVHQYGYSLSFLQGRSMNYEPDLCQCISLYILSANSIIKTHNFYITVKFLGPSEKQVTSIKRTAHLPPIDFTIEPNISNL